jgi:hypothetical protein
MALYEEEGDGVALDLYQRGLGTRQHVDLRSTVRPVHGSFRATGISRGTALACSRRPRVGGAALCITHSVFQHAATALYPPF